ncbi:condensin-2 complex subunit G2-like isoform X2 [Sipha flava]|nr:condensin-2 complex subunit G2-like isoform X2 [Sipha flava]
MITYSVNGFDNPMDNEEIVVNSFILTFEYIFNAVHVTIKKLEMKTLSSLLWEYCKVVSTLSIKKGIDNMVAKLENTLNNSLFLETETGKMIFADIFTTSQQLFLKFHQLVKNKLVKAKKSLAEAFGDIYFISWINSNSSMREVIEEQGIFEIISKTFTFQRTGQFNRTYYNALIFLQSMQKHRKHLIFSKVITKLYTPVIWRNLSSEHGYIRLNAVEILARAYPLEKRGEGREVSSRFLMKQQDAFLDLLLDVCPVVRIAAIKGICSCLQYFWDSFNDDEIRKIFNTFVILMNDSVFEVRRSLFYYYCQLIEEEKSHVYFRNPMFMAKLKNGLNDENEKVRRAFINLLIKIKITDAKAENTEKENKINYAKIVNLKDIADAIAVEDERNVLLLADLVFDNFIGDKVTDKSATLMRIIVFYKMNPTAMRKLMLHSEKHLDFDRACQLILSLLKTVYKHLLKKAERCNNTGKENSLPFKRLKLSDNSEDNSEICESLSTSSEDEQNNCIKVCCILDCVNCLLVLHRNKLIDERDNQQIKDVLDSCVKCLIKTFKLYKEGDAYYSALSLASLFPVSKFSSHVSLPSAAISILQQLPFDVQNAEEEIDMRKVNCLVHTLCMWKRGYEILEFVSVWFDEAFKTTNLNETQYPESTIQERKKVRFKIDVEDCKPMTGVLLVNSMLNNLQTQKTLLDSDVNKKNIYDLISYLHRVKPSIKKRLSEDNILSKLLSDEVLIELFQLHINLHILYHSEENNVDEIIKYQTSILDWVINNILIHDLHFKNETTIIFAANILNAVNNIILNICLMQFVDKTYLDNFFSYCNGIMQNQLSPRILISLIETLIPVAKYFNHLKIMDKLENDTSLLANCICSIISIFSESKFNEERFENIIGAPTKFRKYLNTLIWEINKINLVDFKQVLITLIETIVQIIANHIREIEEVDMNEHLTEIPFSANQLALVILNNAPLRKEFSHNAVTIFSSDLYKNDSFLLISAISYIYTLSFQLNKTKQINMEPIVKLLYTTLMEHDKTKTLLGNSCNLTAKNNQEESILENSDFSNEKIDFKEKGLKILIATAKQLHIALTD